MRAKYKSRDEVVRGVWSRFKPGLGKDKRESGFDKNDLIKIGKKITDVPINFNIHKALKDI